MSKKEKPTDYYPQWLIERTFIDLFDWEKGISTTFEQFLNLATLHDSYWLGLFSNIDNSVNLIISFDAFWNKEIANYSNASTEDWPYLIIKLERVYNLTFDSSIDCGETIGDAKSVEINDNIKEQFIDIICKQSIITHDLAERIIDEKIVKTQIEDVCGGSIEIIHSKSIQMLLYDCKGKLMSIPREIEMKEK